MNKILLLLGSNLGKKEVNLINCLNALTTEGIRIEKVSSIYLTSPEGVSLPHPDYYNMAVLAYIDLCPRELLDVTNKVERKLGRKTKGDLAPRVIDIDLLLYDGLEIVTPSLTLPHPQVFKRDYVIHIVNEIGFYHFPEFKRQLFQTLKMKPKPSGMKIVVKRDYIICEEDKWIIVTSER